MNDTICEERYDNLDGLRVISCLCIIAMHVKANTDYQIEGWIYNTFVSSWTQFVPLFLLISGFGMFCGYYVQFRESSGNLNIFYSRRYKKIVPFFALLILIDVVMEHSFSYLAEGAMEVTMVFGLLPNNELSVIGIGWTLGVVFLFYMLFPFAVYLCWSKRRAVFSFFVTIIISSLCSIYFFSEKFVIDGFSFRHSFLYCAPFFIGGGCSWLYREPIRRFISKHRIICLYGVIGITTLYYVVPNDLQGVDVLVIKNLILFLPWIWYGISVKSRLLNNRVIKYLSGISMELYLAQMVIFRGIEKVGLIYTFGRGWGGFIGTWIMMIVGLVVFVETYRFMLKKIKLFRSKL